MVLEHLSCLVDAVCLAVLAVQVTEPSLAAAWQVRPTGQLAFVPLLLPAAVVAAGSTWNCAAPGLEVCLALTPDHLDQLRFHPHDAAAQRLGWEEEAGVAVVEVQGVLPDPQVSQEQLVALTVGLVLESPPSCSAASLAAGLAAAVGLSWPEQPFLPPPGLPWCYPGLPGSSFAVCSLQVPAVYCLAPQLSHLLEEEHLRRFLNIGIQLPPSPLQVIISDSV